MKTTKFQIREYMLRAVEDHIDWRTLEVNCTLLAEDAASHFQDYEDDGSIDQTYFDLAIETGQAKERELKKKGG